MRNQFHFSALSHICTPGGLTANEQVWILASRMPLERLTRARIVQALNLLGELAEQEGVTLELCIYGGSAMMLAYGAREGTKDVDAIVRPSEVGARLARQIAGQLGLDESWLNDDVRKFVSDGGTFAPLEIQELESSAKQHLRITRASASYLLAMKCLACRPDLPGWQGTWATFGSLFGRWASPHWRRLSSTWIGSILMKACTTEPVASFKRF